MSAPHGFDDDDATFLLLRTDPPAASLLWVEESTNANVTSVEAVLGGTSSAIHRITVISKTNVHKSFVLRRYVRSDPDELPADLAARETQSLRAIQGLDLPTPEVVAADESGERTDVPAVLMSDLAGRIEWAPADVEPWLRGLAEALPHIHSASADVHAGMPDYGVYAQDSYDPPPWASDPSLWERAVEIATRRSSSQSVVLVHRDYHPGNVLWSDQQLTGVVDWQDASTGPPSVDVSHCRINLIRSHGVAAADEFARLWAQISGMTFDPWADVATVVDFLDQLRESKPSSYPGVEGVLARAVAELSG
ncbi:MAG TPA: aminoglycoside phosphotransferase family protein [Actinomycetes bacterium]|nr:aminoglycoside phosphotransferase family protein [Actinomycetes bacterium]